MIIHAIAKSLPVARKACATTSTSIVASVDIVNSLWSGSVCALTEAD